MSSRSFIFVVLLMAASCSSAGPSLVLPPSERTDAPEPVSERIPREEPTPEEQLMPFAGRYRISRELELDECGGRIVGRAQVLVVDARLQRVHADRVERFYHARVEGDRLIAENRFDERACPESTHFARWNLARTPEGALDGTVESQWLLPPCTNPCVVRFRIFATPIP